MRRIQFSLKTPFYLALIVGLALVATLPTIGAVHYVFFWPGSSWHRVPIALPPPK